MLELKNIAKKFGTKVIFDAFNLTINAGEVVAIAGPSGGGKTTLLRMLAGLESIDSGQVVFDEEVIGLDELDETVGIGFIEGDMRDLSNVGTYDAVTCYSDSICYMPDREAVQEVFDGVWNCLNADGTFIFDVHSVNQIDQVFPGYSYHENEEDFAFMWDSFPGEKAHSITHELTFFVKDADGKFERRDEVHEERTYSIDNYLTMLDNAGFVNVTVFSDFQDITPSEKDDSARWFFIAKKG